MDDTFAQIEALYCPPLDPALLSAILSDHDVADQQGLRNAKKMLDGMKEDALLDESAAFDPSGTGGAEGTLPDGNLTESHPETSASLSRGTDSASLSNGVSSVDLEEEPAETDASNGVYDVLDDFDRLEEGARIKSVQGMFGDQISRYSIQHALRKCDGKWHLAVEDLLSQAYFADTENMADGDAVHAKGIDAFSEEYRISRGRKGKAKTSKPKEQNGSGIQIIPSYAPPEGLDADSSGNAVTKKAKSAASSRSPSSDVASTAVRRDRHDLAKVAAFTKASAAHRKAKSNALMGGAAAYYGQVGRENAALSSAASEQAADEHVASQSTSTQLDLHGVDVRNAVRIAQEKVEEWWDNLGESRVNGRIGADDRQAGYRIVVGLGRHSEGGKSKLGPAVTKMLKDERWRIESAGPVIVVKGPLKK